MAMVVSTLGGVPFSAAQSETAEPGELPPDPGASAVRPADPAAAGSAAASVADLFGPLSSQAAAAAYARPLPLAEALTRAADPSRRLWIVQAYWKTAAAFAAVKSFSLASQRIDLVAPGGDPYDRAVLDMASAAAQADFAEAVAALGSAQQELADLARLPPGEPPPWPVDRPLAAPFQTQFDSIFAQRIATGRVRAIARTLPARLEALEARARAARAASDAMAVAESDHAKGRRPIEAVVAAHAAIVGAEQEFVRSVRAYNADIAEYVMAVVELSLPDDSFRALLSDGLPPQPISPVGFSAVPGTAPAASAAAPGATGVLPRLALPRFGLPGQPRP